MLSNNAIIRLLILLRFTLSFHRDVKRFLLFRLRYSLCLQNKNRREEVIQNIFFQILKEEYKKYFMRPTIQRLRSIDSSIIHVISFSLHLFFFFKILSKRSIKLSPQQNWYNHVTLIGFSFWIALSLAFLKFQTSTCSRTSTLHFNLSLTNEQLNL